MRLCNLHDSWPGECDPDSLVFAHEDGRHDLTGFCSVKEGVLQRQQVGPCEEEAVFKYHSGAQTGRLFKTLERRSRYIATGAENYSLLSGEIPLKDHGGTVVHCDARNDTHLSESPE